MYHLSFFRDFLLVAVETKPVTSGKSFSARFRRRYFLVAQSNRQKIRLFSQADTLKSDYRERTGTEWLVLGLELGLGLGLVVSYVLVVVRF